MENLTYFFKRGNSNMAKSDGGFGLGTMIFIAIIVFNVIGDDDDESNTNDEVAIEVQQQPVAEQIQETASEVVQEAKKVVADLREAIEEEMNQEELPDEVPVVMEERDETIVIKEEPKEHKIKELDEADIPSTFKKL